MLLCSTSRDGFHSTHTEVTARALETRGISGWREQSTRYRNVGGARSLAMFTDFWPTFGRLEPQWLQSGPRADFWPDPGDICQRWGDFARHRPNSAPIDPMRARFRPVSLEVDQRRGGFGTGIDQALGLNRPHLAAFGRCRTELDPFRPT